MPTSTAATTMRASSPAAEAVDLDRHAQRRVRPLQLRQLHVERQRAAPCGRSRTTARRWRGPACAAPARRADGARSRPHRRRCPSRVPTGTLMRAVPGCHLLGDRAEQPVADDVERDAAGGARGDRDRHRLARLVLRLVERDLQHVGRVGAGFGVPAGVEADRGHRPVRRPARDFEPIAAPLHRHRDAARLVGRDIELAVGDAARELDRLVAPSGRRGDTTDSATRP